VSSHHLKFSSLRPGVLRRGVSAMVVTATMAVLGTMMSPTATADPGPPGDTSTAIRQLNDLNRQAEVLTERWHYARDQLNTRRADADRARADANTASASAVRAMGVQGQYREQVDRLTNASFQGARLNQLSALLVSTSPKDFLDQMSALDILAVENKEALDRLTGAVAQTRRAELSARDAAARAVQAEHDAALLEADLTHSRIEMDRQIQVVTKRLAELNRQQRAAYLGGGDIHFPVNLIGTDIEVRAARAALSKQGSSYVWGGDGPMTFDCSGLVKWAYAQVGFPGLPHSAAEQARMGRTVSRSELQPGDLIALYSPISHIGIYVGNGLYVNAPQSGDVVKVAPVPWHLVTAMSRIG
jgi:peptidoglycan DL-endopeptidase CwlO